MTRQDVERYVRNQLGAQTDAERDRRQTNQVRFANPNPDQKLIEPTSSIVPYFMPPGFQAGDVVTTAAPVTNQSNAIYLGRPDTDKALVTFRCNVVTAVATAIVWAEVAICTSVDNIMATGADLILSGFTDVTGTFNATGNKTTEINVNISRGAHTWLVWGSQATTPFALRGGLADPINSGIYQFAAATRPSTMTNPTTFTVTGSASVAAWLVVQW